MLKYPRFKPSFHVEIFPPSQVMLFDDQGKGYKLEGKAYPLIAEQLLGPRSSLARIVARLKKLLPQEDLYYAVFRLYKKGFIEETDSRLAKPLSAFCHLIQSSIREVPDLLQKKTITPHFVGKISSKEFKKRCSQMSIQWSQEGILDVVFADNYRHKELALFHKKSLVHQRPWLLVQPKGPEIWIGPLFIPRKTACFQCLMLALKNNRCDQVVIEESQKRNAPISHTAANLPIAEPIAASLAAGEIFKWIVKNENARIEGKILSLNLCSMEMKLHTVLKRTYCEDCGEPLPDLPSSPFVFEGLVPPPALPEEINRKYGHLVSPITGIVASLIQVPPPSSAIHNFFGGIHVIDLEFLRRYPTAKEWMSASGGKGRYEAQARALCLCEAIERHSGVYQGNEVKKKATYRELGKSAVHPESVLLFSEHQYLIRDEWNQNCHRYHFIPDRFDETETIDWSPLWSLSECCWKWMPTAFCYYGYHQKERESFCRGNSNGCASGNTKIEAALSGFFELVERDGVALWWYPRLCRPGVNLESFEDPYIAELIKYYASQKRKVWALDLTTDLGIPAIAVCSSDFSGKEILFGFGANLDAKAALMGALLEMNQGYNFTHWQGGKMLTQNRRTWMESATVHNQPYLLPNSNTPEKKASDYSNLASRDPKENLSTCLKIGAKNDLEMLILDQTRPHIGMPVIRVVVPGLRHFWNQFGAGRLYEVPVKMGWMKQKIQEEDLNPIPMFL